LSNEKEQIKQQDLEQDIKEADEQQEPAEAEAAVAKNVDDSANDSEQTVDELAELQAQVEAEQNKYLRLLADFDNFKRRAKLDQEIAKKFRSQSLLTDLLPVLDNFERALATETKSDESATILKGVSMVQKSLLEAVKAEGLGEIKSTGEPFDPHFHQAVIQESDPEAEPGIVLQELQKGYTLNGRVLRPAMVKVNE
jgi:molecular chaperone GrpE